MLKQKAILKKVNKNIEEEVVLEVDDIEFVGFANIVPYKINEGYEYEVLLGITVLDDFYIEEVEIRRKEIKRVNDDFEYIIRGKLQDGGKIDAGIIIEDELLEEYNYLVGKYVEIKVDRISVEFL